MKATVCPHHLSINQRVFGSLVLQVKNAGIFSSIQNMIAKIWYHTNIHICFLVCIGILSAVYMLLYKVCHIIYIYIYLL